MNAGAASYLGTNIGDGTVAGTPDGRHTVGFVNPQDFLVDSLMWRNNTNTSFPILVAHMVPVNLLANYHLTSGPNDAVARNAGAASYGATQPAATVNAPNHDIDNQGRPQLGAFDRGADELGAASADLSVTKTDGVTTANVGDTLTYTITVSNAGPDPVTGAAVVDTLPSGLTGTGINTTVNSAPGASQVFTVTAQVNNGRDVVGVEHRNGDGSRQRRRSVDG